MLITNIAFSQLVDNQHLIFLKLSYKLFNFLIFQLLKKFPMSILATNTVQQLQKHFL